MIPIQNMNPRALNVCLKIALQPRIRCSGVSGSMSENRQFAQEAMLIHVLLEPAVPKMRLVDGICFCGVLSCF